MTTTTSAKPAPLPRKGQLFKRTSDGFVFRAESVSRAVGGALLQCVDATKIVGFYYAADIARDFVRVEVSS